MFSGDWEIDMTYTATDSEGWSYGINFEYIMSNYRRSQSCTSPQGRTTRRRRWIRKMKKISGEDGMHSPERTETMSTFQRETEYEKCQDR